MTSECRGPALARGGCGGRRAQSPAEPGAGRSSHPALGGPGKEGNYMAHCSLSRVFKAERKAGNLGSDSLATNVNSCGAARSRHGERGRAGGRSGLSFWYQAALLACQASSLPTLYSVLFSDLGKDMKTEQRRSV